MEVQVKFNLVMNSAIFALKLPSRSADDLVYLRSPLRKLSLSPATMDPADHCYYRPEPPLPTVLVPVLLDQSLRARDARPPTQCTTCLA